jgi:hypothetical protein
MMPQVWPSTGLSDAFQYIPLSAACPFGLLPDQPQHRFFMLSALLLRLLQADLNDSNF